MSADQLRAVECELSKKEVEARSLQSQLATCAQHVEEYKAIAKTVEEEFAYFKAAKEAEVKALQEQVKAQEQAAAEVKQAEAAKQAQESKAEAEAGQRKQQVAALESEVAALRREKEELKARLEAEKQTSGTMERNYLAELQNHVQSTQLWNEKEKQMEQERAELARMKEELGQRATAEQNDAAARAAEEAKWKELLAEKELRLDSLTKQNDVLFDQIAQLTRRDRESASEKADSAVQEESPLREVVVSLRRDCEIAKSSLALQKTLVSEKEKALQETEAKQAALEKELSEVKKELGELQSKGDIDAVLAREQEASRLLAVYTESNNALRQENESINEEMKKMKEAEAAGQKATAEARQRLEAELKQEKETHAAAVAAVAELKKREGALQAEKKSVQTMQARVADLQQRLKVALAQRKVPAKPVQAVQQAQAAKPVQVVQQVQKVQQMQQVQAAKPVQQMQAAKPAQQAQQTQPVKAVQAVQQAQAAKPVQQAVQQTQAAKQAQQAQQAQPTQASQPAAAMQQAQKAQQTQQAQPKAEEGPHGPFTRRMSADASPFTSPPARLFAGLLNTQAQPKAEESALKKAKANDGSAVETATLNEKMMTRKQRFAWANRSGVMCSEGMNAQQQPHQQQQQQQQQQPQPQRRKEGLHGGRG